MTTSGNSVVVAFAVQYSYFGSSTGRVVAVMTHTGEQVWAFQTPAYSPITGGLVLAPDGDETAGVQDLFAVARNGNLYRLAGSTGFLVFTVATVFPIQNSPTAFRIPRAGAGATGSTKTQAVGDSGGVILFSSWDYSVWCVNASTGGIMWRYLLSIMPTTALTVSSNGGASFGGGGWDYLAIDWRDGTQLWTVKTAAFALAQPTLGTCLDYLFRLSSPSPWS